MTSDATLIDLAAEQISIPRADPASSFVLHAPLELLARTALLPAALPEARDAIRSAIGDLAHSFSGAGPAMIEPPRASDIRDPGHALKRLEGAITRGELDDADTAAAWLADHLTAEELASALADPIVPLLSAAAHGSIFLYHLPRVAPRSRPAARMLRSLVREVARYPGWELSWFRDAVAPAPWRGDAVDALEQRMTRPRSPGDPGSTFIFPMMSLTERSGLACEVLGDLVGHLSVADARRALLRTAARSILQDNPDSAPYGWSHCLTMPQATLAVAERCVTPAHAIAVASTYVLGFRAVEGTVAIARDWTPATGPVADPVAALEGSPDEAAAAVWHADPSLRPAIRAALASFAGGHHDAHLVKYTLACFDAAHDDPDAEALFLAAAAYLGAWWRTVDAVGASAA